MCWRLPSLGVTPNGPWLLGITEVTAVQREPAFMGYHQGSTCLPMPGAEKIQLDEQAQQNLQSIAANRTSEVRSWERASIILVVVGG